MYKPWFFSIKPFNIFVKELKTVGNDFQAKIIQKIYAVKKNEFLHYSTIRKKILTSFSTLILRKDDFIILYSNCNDGIENNGGGGGRGRSH